MPSFRTIRDGTLDEDALDIAAEIYFQHRTETEWDDDKWSRFDDFERWLERNELEPSVVNEFVQKLIDEKPDHPLVHTTHLDNLASAAEENPDRVSKLLGVLYDEERELAGRINEFREGVSIGSDGIGYLLAVYDRKQYAPYADEVFSTFRRSFSGNQEPSYASIGDKYALYCEYLATISDFFREKGYLDEVLALDAQEFIYTIIEHDEVANDYRLEYLFDFANTLKVYEDDINQLLNGLHDLPEEYIRSQAERFEGYEKVREVRYQIASAIVADETIALERIKQEENEKHDTNIFQSWTDFTIAVQLYLNFYKDRIDGYLQELINYLRSELRQEELEAHVVTFQGINNFPTTRCWVALHPAEQDFRSSFQLYFHISADDVEYGLVRGSEIREDEWGVDTDRIEDSGELGIRPIVDKFRSLLDEFERRNRNLTEPDGVSYEVLENFPEISRQLKKSKQMIFYGPPGTGKTFAAVNFARWWIDEQDGDYDEQIEMVTFHPSFTYEDFLEGLTATASGGSLTFEIDKGIFAEFCERARAAYEESEGTPPRYVLVIDEINRGNLAGIFGETITLLEADKRSGERGEMTVTLAHSSDSFSIPTNLYIIGTMNTADRSIALVDAAIRRRFRFTAFPPDYDLLLDRYGFEEEADARAAAMQDDGEVSLQALSILALREINQRILETSSLGRGKQIGHTYLLNREGEKAIIDAWKYEMLPLLEEYYFGQFEKLRTQIFDGEGGEFFDWETQQIIDFDEDGLRMELQRLINTDEL